MWLLKNKGQAKWPTFKWLGLPRRLAEKALADCGVMFMFMKVDESQICWGVAHKV